MREGLAGNAIESVHGILNGTCNYILTRMENEGLPFDEVLSDAQKLGYAEADPSLDIDGFDTAHKACILAALAYGFQPTLGEVQVEGIRNLDGADVKYAAELGYRIKLLATVARHGDQVEVGVHPTLVSTEHMLANVNGVFNAAMVRGDMADDTLYYGRGAGRAPTASTVVGDIGDIARNIAHGETRYARAVPSYAEGKVNLLDAGEVTSRFYIRFMVSDKAGSLGSMTSILGSYGVSISAAMQKKSQNESEGFVPVVMLTHPAKAAALEKALDEIKTVGILAEDPVKLRML
jgi:homoserine dehydrogenase